LKWKPLVLLFSGQTDDRRGGNPVGFLMVREYRIPKATEILGQEVGSTGKKQPSRGAGTDYARDKWKFVRGGNFVLTLSAYFGLSSRWLDRAAATTKRP
jgi:hypothetical protein